MTDIAVNPNPAHAIRPKSPLSPQLKIQPASEWAEGTLTALDSTKEINLQSAITPGPELPGAYPYTPSTGEPGPSFEEVKATAKEYFSAAGQYVPSQEEIRKMAQGAGEIVGGYIPNGVATYLGSTQPQQEVPATPIEESETTPTSGDSFVLINRGSRNPGSHTKSGQDINREPSDGSAHTPQGTSRASEFTPTAYPYETAVYSGLGDEPPSENASTRTQRGSLATPGRWSGSNGNASPFSYTAGAAAVFGQGNSGVQTAATYGLPHEDHVNLTDGSHPERRGHPDGTINHGGVDMKLGPGGEGTVDAPGSGIAASPGPGPGITQPNGKYSFEKERQTFDRDERGAPLESSTMKPNGDTIVQSTGKGKERGSTEGKGEKRRGLGINGGRLSGEGEKTGQTRRSSKEKGRVGEMSNDTVNTKARTHPLGKEGTQWKGVPLEEQYQAALDRNEDRGLRIGETAEKTVSGVRTESVQNGSTTFTSKPPMEQVQSNTATIGHERVPSGSSKFREGQPPSEQDQSKPKDEATTGAQPRAGSPMSSTVNPHVGKAVNGPNAAKLAADPDDVSPERRSSKRKSRFMSKIKAWSKRLSQEKN